MSTTTNGTPSPDLMMHAAKTADVTNQAVLALDCSAWWWMSQADGIAIRKIQLEYAQKVSQAAADAYAKILALA